MLKGMYNLNVIMNDFTVLLQEESHSVIFLAKLWGQNNKSMKHISVVLPNTTTVAVALRLFATTLLARQV